MTPEPPHLYTREEWAAMDRTTRRLVRAHRARAVAWAQAEHERTYRPWAHRAVLADAIGAAPW
jgi:hypothetical protein